ncbi:MAG: c-type cytochrome [Planctomycetes bacterium]|nr:c-type cytochrome [Planctomycetota bacterium]
MVLFVLAVVGNCGFLSPVCAQDAAQKAAAAKPVGVKQAKKKTGERPKDAKKPHWIWNDKSAKDQETIYVRRTVDFPHQVKSALLRATCDNVVTVWLNGQQVVQNSDWSQAPTADVSKILVQGKNVIAAECRNDGGPGGFLFVLDLETAEDQFVTVVSDESWKTSPQAADGWRDVGFDDKNWATAVSLGELGVGPWNQVAIDGAKVPATSPSEITVLPGFQVELLYSVPKATEGSWVSITTETKGRLIVSDQGGYLYRVTPGPNEEETVVEKIDLPIGSAQGLLYAFDSLYVVVNGSAPGGAGSGFYRVRDTNGDDVYDEVKLLKSLDGGGEHGPHAVRLGPDGALYVMAGNFTRPPAGYDPLSAHRNFSEDHLLKRNPDGNGFATGLLAPGGWICRTDAEGREWKLICGGFRNEYDFAFNPEGEIFTYDADMEWDTGTPWYRPTRVNHAVSGAEFGWRYGTGKWPAYYVDSVGAVADIGLGSPTGVEMGTGAHFPAKYQRALYINDWTYGKMYALHLQPVGATYTATFETFISGKPLPLTDMCIGPDGAMYFTIGGRSAQSGLYRVTYIGKESRAPVGSAVDPAAAKARELRHKLESFHEGTHPEAVEFVWPHLNSPDRAIRYAARIAVEHQDLALWKDKALAEKRVNARIQALAALCRVGTENLQSAVLARLNELPFKKLTEEQFLDALRVYELAFIRLGGKHAETTGQVLETLDPLFPAESDLINRGLCSVLTYLAAPKIIDRGLELLSIAQTQQDQLYYVFTLRNLETGWTLGQRQKFFGWLALARGYSGGASFQKFIDQIRNDAVATLSEADKTALNEVIEGSQKIEAVKLTTTRQFVHNWQMSDLVPHLAKAGTGRSFEKGKAAFEAAQCAKCHRFRNVGGDTGPDITGVGGRFDARYILEALIEPSKVISDQYVNSVFELKDGRVVTGRVINKVGDKLSVRTDPFARELTEIDKGDILHSEPSKISEMPQGLINVLTPEEILDLVAYLRSGGDPNDKLFQK